MSRSARKGSIGGEFGGSSRRQAGGCISGSGGAKFGPVAILACYFQCLKTAPGWRFPELTSAFEAILQLRTERFNRAGTRSKAFGGIVLVVETVAIGLKILDFPLDQITKQALEVAGVIAKAFQGFAD